MTLTDKKNIPVGLGTQFYFFIFNTLNSSYREGVKLDILTKILR